MNHNVDNEFELNALKTRITRYEITKSKIVPLIVLYMKKEKEQRARQYDIKTKYDIT